MSAELIGIIAVMSLLHMIGLGVTLYLSHLHSGERDEK